jgi:hypothetical protein
MKALYEKFEKLQPGEKITVLVETIAGFYAPVKVTYRGKLEPYGFVSKRTGGWALTSDSTFNIPCYRCSVRPYRCTYGRQLNLNDVKDIKKGWEKDEKNKKNRAR